ncbi:MAG: hypothetical protein QG603_408 [Patescibacteria group bacterium]|nr:hypothetical protein [Patescibacteria group bacterium]MDQ5970631.1 hypothetical protein [Patescibacteria group bacterium]
MLHKQTAKLIAVIAQNMPEMSSDAMQRYINDPKGVQILLRKVFLTFPILMTVKLGTGLITDTDFLLAFERQWFRRLYMGSDAMYMIRHRAFKVAEQLIEVSIVTPSVAELGFKKGARYADICDTGVSMGYDLCSAELGPQLRLQYKKQPKGDSLWLAMERICSGEPPMSRSYVFHLKRDAGGRYFYGDVVDADTFFDADVRFVFVCRK